MMEILLVGLKVVLVIIVILFIICGITLSLMVCLAGKNRDKMEEEAEYKRANCRDCIFDITDKDNPSWKECGANDHIPDEVFDEYDDDHLPQHCGQFKRKKWR